MEEKEKEAGELVNTQEAGELSNTQITKQQFIDFAKGNGWIVYEDEQSFNDMKSNVVKDAVKNATSSIRAEAKEQAKKTLMKEFNLELSEDAKLSDAYEALRALKSSGDASEQLSHDNNKLRATIQEMEKAHEEALKAKIQEYESRDFKRTFDTVYNREMSKYAIDESNSAEWLEMARFKFEKSFEKGEDRFYKIEGDRKIELVDPRMQKGLSAEDVIKSHLQAVLPKKSDVKGGLGYKGQTSTQKMSDKEFLQSISHLSISEQNKAIDDFVKSK